MSFASPHPISAEPASPVALPPSTAVNAGGIAEGRPRAAAPQTLGAMLPDRAAWDGWHLRAPARPPAGPLHPRPAGTPGLRLLPAEAFHWAGSRGLPRTRGDHALILLTAGAARLRLPRAEAAAAPLLFLPAGTAFTWQPEPGAEGAVLLVGRDFAAAATAPLPSRLFEAAPSAAEAEALQADLAALAAGMQREDAGARQTLEARLGRLAQRLRRIMGDEAGADPLADRFLALAAREMPRRRSLPELASALGCTLARLDRACLARHGSRAAELMQTLQVGRAVELLAVTSRSVELIARDAGFAEASHMSLALTAATGRPPEAWRGQSHAPADDGHSRRAQPPRSSV